MKTAIISLPKENTVYEGSSCNLHGYWTPPEYVIDFWASACMVEFISDADYESKKKEIHKSYKECIQTFYKEFAL